jgi:transcriptional regulator with XRE-family HTH domain
MSYRVPRIHEQVDSSKIAYFERGEENVSVNALTRIAGALKVRLRDLVGDV